MAGSLVITPRLQVGYCNLIFLQWCTKSRPHHTIV